MACLLVVFAPRWLTNWEDCWWSCCCDDESAKLSRELKRWRYEVKRAIENAPPLVISPDLCKSLLLENISDDDEKDFSITDKSLLQRLTSESQQQPLVFSGVPRRPFHRELANRLFLFFKEAERVSIGGTPPGFLQEMNPLISLRPLVAAESMGMTELPLRLPPPPDGPNSVRAWLQEAGDDGVFEILGMRRTIGTDERGLLPPTWKALLQAASVQNSPNKSKLTVAARARAKHAHRGKERFFGIVQGGDEEQNAASLQVVLRLLQEAVWINCHAFGGTGGIPVLEVRVASGYGARWKADWSTDPPANVEFRGFLEPQVADGHEKQWRH